MPIHYTKSAEQDGAAYLRLQQASQQLDDILGSSAGVVEAVWDRTVDRQGHPRYVLTLRDELGEKDAGFAPDELDSPTRMRFRLLQLWGRLLQLRSEAILHRMGE